MSERPRELPATPGGLWRLRRLRAYARRGWGGVVALVVAIHYSVLSMWASGMLVVAPTGQPWSAYWVAAAGAPDWWDYPALVLFGPSVVVAFPPALTAVMLLVASLVGLTVAASVNLLWARSSPTSPQPRARPQDTSRIPLANGAVPLLVALVSLGTGCGADFTVAGLAVLGGSAGATRAGLVQLSLLLGIFDLGVLFASLVLLERALRDAEAPEPPRSRARSGSRSGRPAPGRASE